MKAIIKTCSLAALVSVTSSMVAFTNMDERMDELEREMKEVGVTNPQGTYGAGFVTADPEVKHEWNLSVEPLYWHAKVGGTEYAYTRKDVNATSDLLLPHIKGDVKDQEFGWEWGVRVGLGCQFSHDDWDANLNYTWYESDDSSSVLKNIPSTVVSLKLAEMGPFQVIKSHYDLNYNNINLELGRHFFISSRVSIRPQMGVRSTWLYEKQKVTHNIALIQGTSSVISGKVQDKSVMWGIGPRMGIESEGELGDGFSLYGKVTGSLLYSYFRNSFSQKLVPVSDLGTNFNMHFSGKSHLFVPNIQMMLGLVWETYLNDKRQHLTLGAGYEIEYFWRANQMLEADDSVALLGSGQRIISLERISEDVMLYGITLKARLDF